jgi:hypothetical protein
VQRAIGNRAENRGRFSLHNSAAQQNRTNQATLGPQNPIEGPVMMKTARWNPMQRDFCALILSAMALMAVATPGFAQKADDSYKPPASAGGL